MVTKCAEIGEINSATSSMFSSNIPSREDGYSWGKE